MGTLSDFHQDVESVALRLVADYRESLMAEAVSLCDGDRAAAEDLVFRTLEVLFRGGGPAGPDRGPMLAWLRGVMRRIHHDATRGKARAAVVYLDPETLALVSDARAAEVEGGAAAAPAPAPDVAAAAHEDADAVRAAVDSLPPKMRETIVLHYFEGVPVARMAAVLRISQDAVKCRLYYARKVLAQRLRKHTRGPVAKALLIALALAALTGVGAMIYAATTTRARQADDNEPATVEASLAEVAPPALHPSFAEVAPSASSFLPSTQPTPPPMKRSLFLATTAAAYALAAPCALALPSASLLDYVESTGSQYIDTCVVGADGIRMEAEMEWTAQPSSASVFCGAAASGTGKYFTLYTSAGSHQMGYDSWSAAQIQDGSKATADTRFRVESFLEAGSQFLNVRKLDGSGYTGTRTYNTAASVDTGANLYIFARNDAGTAALFSSARLYFLKLWKKDGNGNYELVRHYIPCLDNGAAALYDKVSGSFAYPQGGDLAAGPVLPRPVALVKWVQSDGSSGSRGLYIDTGIPAKAGTGMTAEMEWVVRPSTASAFCGAMSSDNNRVTLYTSAGAHQMGYGTWDAQIQGGGNAANADVRYRVSSSLTAGAQYLNVKALDGSGYDGTRTYNTSSAIDTAQPLYLFARNDAGTPNQLSSVRLYSLVLTNDLGVVRDFTPCVADNGKAGLYDDVSGRVFFPKAAVSGATAEFDLGTEVGPATNIPASTSWPQTRPEWIEANGTNDYVDLGVAARDGTRMLAEVEWNALPSAATFCGAATNDTRGLFTTYRITTGEGSNFHRIGYYNGSSTMSGGNAKPAVGVRYKVETSLADGEQVFTVAKQENGAWVPVGNGSRTVNLSFPAGYADLGLSFYLFARNFNGVADEFAPARLYSFKLWQNGALVRDLCPAFDPADNAPALFDKVSGRYFRNDGGYRLTAGGETTPFPGQTTVIIMR